MPRAKRSAGLDSNNARRKLAAERYHMEHISPGRYLLYRKPKNGAAGTWTACFQNLETKKQWRNTFAVADDFQDANGTDILTYRQALAVATAWFKEQDRKLALEEEGETVNFGPFTVAHAIEAYFKDAERRGVKGLDRDKQRANAWIIPAFGEMLFVKLTRTKIEKWLDMMANSPKRLRTKIGKEQAFAAPPQTEDEKRARKDSANRVLTILKAALTFAVDRRLVDSIERPWELVKPYRGTTNARIRFLTQDEQIKLINVCPPGLQELVKAGLLTGCRYGELARLQCKDYNPDNGTIFIAESKSGKPRYVYLTDEGKELFDGLALVSDPESPIFTNAITRKSRTGGVTGAWMAHDQVRMMKDACEKAGIEEVSFHELRHTYASMLVNRGCLLSVVAQQLGHSDTRMVEKHYAHLAPNTVRNEILRTMPTLGITKPPKIQKLKVSS